MSAVEDEVCALIQARAEVGKAKYGVTMEREDLSHDEWLEHLQNELLDAAVYIQRLRTREQTIEAKLRELLVVYLQASEAKSNADNHLNSANEMWSYAAGDLKLILDGVSE